MEHIVSACPLHPPSLDVYDSTPAQQVVKPRRVLCRKEPKPLSSPATSEVSTARGRGRKPRRSRSYEDGGGGKRLRRWVSGRLGAGRTEGWGGRGARRKKSPALPTEEAVKRWMVVVLGSRALIGAGEPGKITLAEWLRDGRILVRLVKAIGGARMARTEEVRGQF